MKKFLFTLCVVMALVMSSCSPKFTDKFYYLDYSRFASQGFFITESPTVPFDYTPVGSVYLEEKSGKKKITAVHNPGYDAIYGEDNSATTKSVYEYASSTTALEAMERFAKENNANGIINLKICSRYEGSQFIVSISGMLIKRK